MLPVGDLAGDPKYVVCSTDTNAKLLVAPTLDVNMDDYVKERVSRRATDRRPGEVIYYNWLKHYGWLRGRIVKKVNARKKTQQAQFSKSCRLTGILARALQRDGQQPRF